MAKRFRTLALALIIIGCFIEGISIVGAASLAFMESYGETVTLSPSSLTVNYGESAIFTANIEGPYSGVPFPDGAFYVYNLYLDGAQYRSVQTYGTSYNFVFTWLSPGVHDLLVYGSAGPDNVYPVGYATATLTITGTIPQSTPTPTVTPTITPSLTPTITPTTTPTVTPTATPIQTVTLTTAVSGSGSITPISGTYVYNKNTQVTLNATPTSGSQFSYWLINDGTQSTKFYTSTMSLTLTTSKSALAVFSNLSTPTPSPTPYNPAATPTPYVQQTPTPEPTPLPIVNLPENNSINNGTSIDYGKIFLFLIVLGIIFIVGGIAVLLL